jgi:GT2 family glycosyltransferase
VYFIDDFQVNNMDVSAVVLSFNSKNYIETCVDSLVSAYQQSGLTGEIVVIENGSTDGSISILRRLQDKYPEHLQVIYLGRNTGTTYSRNRGLAISKGKYILILDSDAYMNAAALTGMKDWLDANPTTGLVSPKLTYPDGRFQLSVDTFPTLSRKFQRFFMLKQMEAQEDVQLTEPTDIDYAISACWMFPAETYYQIGALDEKIFYSPEDVDFCLRVWQSGKKITYLPQFSVVHDAQEKSRGFKVNYFTYLHIKGLMYFFNKHKYVFKLENLYRRLGRK